MAHQSKSGTAQFALDISPDAKLRFESLYQSMGLKTKAQTFEAILYFVSTKDKIDPAFRMALSPARLPKLVRSADQRSLFPPGLTLG